MTQFPGLAKSCIGLRSTLIKMGTRKKLYAACDDLDHFACLHVYGRFLESFLVAQNNPLVRFDLACRSDARHSYNWLALISVRILPNFELVRAISEMDV